MDKFDVIIIGAGPAGLLAAGRAAELGGNVLVLEKMKSEGRKLLITGKGRCNITNNAAISEFITHVYPNRISHANRESPRNNHGQGYQCPRRRFVAENRQWRGYRHWV